MSDELKPCPFCGGCRLTLERNDIPFGILQKLIEWWRLSCLCGVNISYPSRGGLIKTWNTRADLAIPDGFALVPLEPTDDMIEAARARNALLDGETMYHGIYKAMLSARHKIGGV